MNGSILKTDVYTDFQGLSALRTRAKNDSEDTLREVAGQFEALFIQMMLKTMRDASLGEGLLDSEHTKTYQAMFDKQIAIDMSKNSGIGLADMMVRQLSRTTGKAPGEETADAAIAHTGEAIPLAQKLRPVKALHDVAEPRSEWKPDSPEDFIREVWPHAERTAADLGVRPEALVAQAALETGWGRHMIRSPNGEISYNLFGIKADSRWEGDRVTTETLEFRDGLMRKERAHFRAYGSLEDGFNDYANFLKGNPRYKEALRSAGDASGFGSALAEAGYATDPDYSRKLNQIVNGERLRGIVSEIKGPDVGPLS